MHWFVHGGVGVVAANAWPNRPILALTVSLTSHYLLDWLPHKDPGIGTTTARWGSPEVREFLTLSLPDGVFTAMLAIALPWLVPSMPFWLTFGCVMAAILPDAIDGLAKLTNWNWLQLHRRVHDWIHYDHYRRPVLWWLNIIIQSSLFTVITIAIYVVLRTNGSLVSQ